MWIGSLCCIYSFLDHGLAVNSSTSKNIMIFFRVQTYNYRLFWCLKFFVLFVSCDVAASVVNNISRRIYIAG